MIDYVKGSLALWDEDGIVVDVQGIGYRVHTPNPYAFAGLTDKVEVYTHYHVREDAVQLFGFATRDEQRLFRMLLDVSGIGPRVALGILAGGTPEAVIAAIRQENLAFLTKLPGIGRKTAQRMVLDLKDKLGAQAGAEETLPLASSGAAGASGGSAAWHEAAQALAALGYRDAEIDKAGHTLREAAESGLSTDALVKRALQLLFQG
ncbi:Holliday junction branch migration protein RuvA [Paenibacillus sp. IB182496]|uniref:Holliday junction branch migration complex subunit RuvA n=1 Tax=Paenibacillus sabuli TaxID=2772509 RepID=A0A927GRC8_9BACL|nr:Holliday junction branch migration protein RuvA [Paenibacillus sabuli]MBD2844592.1 Holliday junction branch migration protein RuvA [Paenibacillus sabuli]